MPCEYYLKKDTEKSDFAKTVNIFTGINLLIGNALDIAIFYIVRTGNL